MDPRVIAARKALNDAVAEMNTRFEAIDAAATALRTAAADAPNRDELTATYEAAQRSFDEAEAAVFTAENEAQRVQRIIDARAKVTVIPGTDDDPAGRSGGDVKDPPIYRRFEGRADDPTDNAFFYFRDLAASQLKGDPRATERLMKHAEQVAAEGRAMSETAGAGGEFIPPLWLMDEWLKVARAGRPFANQIRSRPLPQHTDVINLPALATGTATATQADGGAVNSQDGTTTSVSASVKTLAGQVDIAQQALDRSVPGLDEVLFEDLMADYDTKLDVQLLNGAGSGANALGVLNVSSIKTSTYTSGSPTEAGLQTKGADILQQIAASRFLVPTLWVMHPRRWYWIESALDSSNRPLVVPVAGGPAYNQVATQESVAAENIVGYWHGLPVCIDSSIPTNLGSGTNQDIIIGTRVEDLYLWEEDTPRSRAMEQVLSGNLQVRLQVYGYFAFMPNRYAQAIGTIGGTGLATPTF